MLRSIKTLSPDKHDAILKDLVDFWIQALKQTDGVKFDENTELIARTRPGQVTSK